MTWNDVALRIRIALSLFVIGLYVSFVMAIVDLLS
jgi:hypothetical protein